MLALVAGVILEWCSVLGSFAVENNFGAWCLVIGA